MVVVVFVGVLVVAELVRDVVVFGVCTRLVLVVVRLVVVVLVGVCPEASGAAVLSSEPCAEELLFLARGVAVPDLGGDNKPSRLPAFFR